MTDFNNLPLAEQLKALQPGDELHLRGGGWLPFMQYKGQTNICTAHYVWYLGDADTDIIRVIRPTERKVPELPEGCWYRAIQQQGGDDGAYQVTVFACNGDVFSSFGETMFDAAKKCADKAAIAAAEKGGGMISLWWLLVIVPFLLVAVAMAIIVNLNIDINSP